MTLKKSSANPFGFTFLRTASKNYHFPILIFLLTFIFSTFFGMITKIISFKSRYQAGDFNGTLKEYFSTYVYCLADDEFPAILLSVGISCAAALTAIMIFRYLFSKKSVNVYFSFGMKRTEMFWAKYLSGAFMIVSAVAVPMVITLILNLAFCGSSKELWSAWLYFLLMMFVSVLYSYTVTAAVCCRVGSFIEAGGYGAICVLMPFAIAYFIHVLFSRLVFGSSIENSNWSYGAVVLLGADEIYYPQTFVFELITDLINYIFAPAGDLLRNHYFLRTPSEDTVFDQFRTPDFSGALIWLAVIILIAVIASLFYKNRRAEIAGFLGADEFTKNISVFAVSAAASAFLMDYAFSMDNITWYRGLFASIAVIAFVYMICEIITVHNVKVSLKKLWKLGVHIGAFTLCFFIFYSGLFGYSTRMPELEDIESAAISTGTGDFLLSPSTSSWSSASGGDTPNFTLLSAQSVHGVIDGFTAKEDIEKILDIHKKFIECKNLKATDEAVNGKFGERAIPTKIAIIYTLKDGTTFERSFKVATDEIMQMLSEFTKTEHYVDLVTERLGGFGEPGIYVDDGRVLEISSYNLHELSFRLASKNLTNITLVPALNGKSELKQELMKAICEDIKSGALPLDYVSDENVLGYMIFGGLDGFSQSYYISESYGAEFAVGVESVTTEFFYEDDMPGEDEYDPNAEPKTLMIGDDELLRLTEYNQVGIPVFENMQNTIAFLKANGLDGYFTEAKTPVEIKLWEINEESSGTSFSAYNSSSLLSGAHCGSESEQAKYSYEVTLETAVSVTEPSKIKKYADAARMAYLSCYEGYYAELVFEDGSVTYCFVPFSLIK